MKLEGVLYQPKLIIQLTVADVGLLITCSELHYDAKCNAAGKLGGFLYGWNNVVKWAAEDDGSHCKPARVAEIITDFAECDLAAKITEQLGGPSIRNKDITALHAFFSNCCHVINLKYREVNKDEHSSVKET